MMRLAAASRRIAARRAVAAVEFAVLAPFLFLLAMGAFEVGRAIMVRQVLSDAVARLAVPAPSPAKPTPTSPPTSTTS